MAIFLSCKFFKKYYLIYKRRAASRERAWG